MLFADKPSRSLLPPIEAGAEEILASSPVAGGFVSASQILIFGSPDQGRSTADIPQPEPQGGGSDGHDLGGTVTPKPIDGVVQPAGPFSDGQFHVSDAPQDEDDGPPFSSLSVAWHVPAAKPSGIHRDEGSPNVHHYNPGEPDARPEPDGPKPDDTTTITGGDQPPVGGGQDEPDQPDDEHSVDVTQDATVDAQDADIIVTGYVGEVVAQLYIDQDLVMDQDVDISFTIDGDGNFSIVLDQYTLIDQQVSIDLDIFDVDNVLHVDLFLRDLIVIDQDTTVDISIDDGDPGGTVEINQEIELNQDVDVDIDIEDELEERYAVTITTDVDQTADADQDADVDITDNNGQIDVDVDAVQTAVVEQETVLRADFALV